MTLFRKQCAHSQNTLQETLGSLSIPLSNSLPNLISTAVDISIICHMCKCNITNSMLPSCTTEPSVQMAGGAMHAQMSPRGSTIRGQFKEENRREFAKPWAVQRGRGEDLSSSNTCQDPVSLSYPKRLRFLFESSIGTRRLIGNQVPY